MLVVLMMIMMLMMMFLILCETVVLKANDLDLQELGSSTKKNFENLKIKP